MAPRALQLARVTPTSFLTDSSSRTLSASTWGIRPDRRVGESVRRGWPSTRSDGSARTTQGGVQS
eukprot:scaffold234397_cov33-Tisochrysis_lutea.AAC.3